MTQLSILIPACQEPYLQKTIEDILVHSEADTEVLVGLDGKDNFVPPITGFKLYKSDERIGQRAITNRLARLSTAPYLMKIDAHCSFSQGFDRIMLEDMNENNLLAIDIRDLDVKNWEMKPEPLTSQVVFDTDFELKSAPEKPELIAETQCIHGVGFMVSRKKYFELNLIDESFGSWGLMGLEVPLKIWLSGGKVMVTKKARMGHWYKQGDDIPYKREKTEVQETFNKVKEWARKQNLEWLIKKFA